MEGIKKKKCIKEKNQRNKGGEQSSNYFNPSELK
jgi:hypothetical protein